VVLGSDGIGADMLEEFRIAFAVHRSHDVTATPDVAWSWLEAGWDLFPEARRTTVRWNYHRADSAWHAAYTPAIRAVDVEGIDGEILLKDGRPTRVDQHEVRRRSAEQARRLFALL
jgi:hypothetical protein